MQETMQNANKELAAESFLVKQRCQQLEDERLAEVCKYKPHNV